MFIKNFAESPYSLIADHCSESSLHHDVAAASPQGTVLPVVHKMFKTLISSDGKGPGTKPETSMAGDLWRREQGPEAPEGACGVFTAKDGQGSEKCLILDKYTNCHRISMGSTGPNFKGLYRTAQDWQSTRNRNQGSSS